MLPRFHLTSHSRMSGSRSVTTPSWLFGSWRSFLYSSYVYSCHLFLMSSASVRPIPFLSFIVPIFAWNSPLVSLIFLTRSQIFPNHFFPLFLCIDCLGRLSYLSLLFFGLCIQMDISFLFSLLFMPLLFSTIFKAFLDNHFCLLYFFFLGMVLITDSCTVSWTSVHDRGTLSDLIPWIYLSLPLHNRKGFY